MNSLLQNLPWAKKQTDLDQLLAGFHRPVQLTLVQLWAEETNDLIEKANELPPANGRESHEQPHWFRAGL